ncbi:MAG TPA: class I SAM-dependent rRNA methyltransferase [Pirellulaceae bacterium]|nr:class I SAM-dependent rRNA methyltransferase [Pirellulaceae bacterium]HMO93593.1 class I SAM-dependent rRNA methyltransferase [Pirellulaceae bacterium]HMP70517.1 class I SAM-dependent rRNA methyltransferase [Pirellulaceae bacterium]
MNKNTIGSGNQEDSNNQTLQLRMRKDFHRRLLRGHEWIFSNEIDNVAELTQQSNSAKLVKVTNHRGEFLAWATYNPRSLIAARILSRTESFDFNADWMFVRLQAALRLRDEMYTQPFYRWVFGESDQLPGLVIDRFANILVVQILTAGMLALADRLWESLRRFDFVQGIVVQHGGRYSELEGMPSARFTIGEPPNEIEIVEGNARFLVPLMEGQKTGWFFDQRENRERLGRFGHLGHVLDLFAYTGAWAIQAMLQGAQSATCVERSIQAIEVAARNAQLNRVQLETIEGEVLPVAKSFFGQREFRTIILDPPALVKRKKDFQSGLQMYYQLNRIAMRLMTNEGWFITCSCSYHMPREKLIEIVQHAAQECNKRCQILEIRGQSADHPLHPAMPETEYLKAIFTYVSPA